MVCDSAGAECGPPEMIGQAVAGTLKASLEELLKSMLRVWCTEGQALAKLGVLQPSGIYGYGLLFRGVDWVWCGLGVWVPGGDSE